MTNTLEQQELDAIVSPQWDVDARATDGSTPSLQAQIDSEFERIVSPYMASSGWICTLTIECGTFICACQKYLGSRSIR